MTQQGLCQEEVSFMVDSNQGAIYQNARIMRMLWLDSMKNVDSDLHVCTAETMRNCSGYLDVVLVLTGSNSDDKNSIRLAAGETNWIFLQWLAISQT